MFDSHDFFYEKCRNKETVRPLLPKRCYISGKLLWFKKSVKLTAMYTGPGEPIFEYRWFDTKEYTLALLKGDIKWER